MMTVWENPSYEASVAEVKVGVIGDWYDPIPDESSRNWMGDIFPDDLDHLVVNVEAVLSDKELSVRPKAGPGLKMPEAAADLLLEACDSCWATLSNNHLYDYGAEGLDDSIEALNSRGIQTMGAGENDREAWGVSYLPVGDKRVAIINFSEGEDDGAALQARHGVSGYDPSRVASLIHEEKKQGRTVIVIFHGGRERVNLPPPYQHTMFRSLAEVGADCVIGHHSHVPQSWEIWNGVPLLYSLGNSWFRYGKPSRLGQCGTGVLLNLTAGGKIKSLDVSMFQSAANGLEKLSIDDPVVEHLLKGCELVKDLQSVENAWMYEISRQKALPFKQLVKLLILCTLMPMRVKKGSKGLRAFIGTTAHQSFFNRKLSQVLEPVEIEKDEGLSSYLDFR